MQSHFPTARSSQLALTSRFTAALTFVALACAVALPASAATLDRIKETGRIKLGYLVDARPFTSRSEGAVAEGYGAALCGQVVEQVNTQLSLGHLAVEWVPVVIGDQLREVQQGNVDLLCVPAAMTLGRREAVRSRSRSSRAASAPSCARTLRASCATHSPRNRAQTRCGAARPRRRFWKKTTFVSLPGMTTEEWLARTAKKLQMDARIVTAPDYRSAPAAAAAVQGRRVLRRPRRGASASWILRSARTSWSSIGCSRTKLSRWRWRMATRISVWSWTAR